MILLIVALGAVLLLVLMLWLRLNAFMALIIVSLLVGMAEGMHITKALESVLKGVGSTLGSLALVLAFGAMLGKMVEESGAAQRITYRLIALFGKQRIQWAVLLTGFIVGIPMIYNAGFLVLIPLIFTIATAARLPLLYLGIPMSAALSVTHGLLPPHPAPTAIAVLYKADINQTLFYGILIAVPTVILAGPVFSKFFRHMVSEPPQGLFTLKEFREDEMPGLGISVFTTLIPVLLMLIGAIANMLLPAKSELNIILNVLSDPNIALLLAVLTAMYTLGIRRGRKMPDIMQSLTNSVSSIAMILLIIGAGGAFKQVLLDSGVSDYIKEITTGLTLSPLILAWGISALIRMALGSATVAAITAAGIVLPLMAGSGIRPELMVLATSAGSLMFSHVNDIGFWMFKEYFNLSIKQTFQSWTLMETLVSVLGLLGVLALDIFI